MFDGRIHNFPYVTPMPHLNWATFNGGIVQFGRKSKKEKLHATGSFGGFRSSAFISALFQIYHAIGFNDDILQNVYQFINENDVVFLKLNNVRFKVHKAIESLLDVYFDCKRSEWDPNNLNEFQNKLTSAGVHISLLWDLKQAILNPEKSKPIPNKMRNVHKLQHLKMYINNYGSLNHLDTGTYESYHKLATTGIYQSTSKRHNGLFREMINGIMQSDHNRMINNIEIIVTEGLNYANIRRPIQTEGVSFKRVMNTRKFQFMMFYNNSDFIIEDDDNANWKAISKQSVINTPNKLRSFLFSQNIGEKITLAYPNIQWDRKFNIKYNTFIIQAISYESDNESQMGIGTIYATSKYNKNDSSTEDLEKPRYDYVYIKYENNLPVVCRIILMFTIRPKENTIDGDEEESILLLVQLMYKMTEQNEIITHLGDVYQWASKLQRNISMDYDIVPVQSIMRPVFVIPIFRDGYNLLNPTYLDRFIVLDRKYFDRSGWDRDSQIYTRFTNSVAQQQYLNENQTTGRYITTAVDMDYDSELDYEHCEDDDCD